MLPSWGTPESTSEAIAALQEMARRQFAVDRLEHDATNALVAAQHGHPGTAGPPTSGYLSAGAMQQQQQMSPYLFTQHQMNELMGGMAAVQTFWPPTQAAYWSFAVSSLAGHPRRLSRWQRLTAALRSMRCWWFVHMEAGALYRERVVAGILRLRERPWWAT